MPFMSFFFAISSPYTSPLFSLLFLRCFFTIFAAADADAAIILMILMLPTMLIFTPPPRRDYGALCLYSASPEYLLSHATCLHYYAICHAMPMLPIITRRARAPARAVIFRFTRCICRVLLRCRCRAALYADARCRILFFDAAA